MGKRSVVLKRSGYALICWHSFSTSSAQIVP